MERNCKVSIICAVFNHEKYIRQALDSFLCQKTDFKYEIVITDDASTDGSAAMIREYAEKYPDIIVPIFFEENMYSKNIPVVPEYAIPAARGEYLAFCEGDDYWTDPEKLSIQAAWLDAHPDYSACVHNTMNYYCDTGREVPYNTRYHGDRDLGFADVVNGVGGVFHTSSVMARASLFRELPDYCVVSEKHGVGDHPRAIMFALSGKIRYIDRFMSVYRNNSTPTAWTTRIRENAFLVDRLTGAVEMYTAALGHVEGEDKKLLEQTLHRYEWELLQAKGEYAEMRREPYRTITKQRGLVQTLWLDFKQYCPKLYCLYMKARGMENGIPEKLRKDKR